MKRIAAVMLLGALSVGGAMARATSGSVEDTRQSRSAAKKQEKINKKASKEQRRAMKRAARAQRKAQRASRRHPG